MPLKPLASGIGPLRTALPLALISQMYRYKVYIEVDPQRCLNSEASVLYALFSVKEWRTTQSLELSASATLDDTYLQLRKRMLTLIVQDRRSWTPAQIGLAMPAWGCLSDALWAGMMRHDSSD